MLPANEPPGAAMISDWELWACATEVQRIHGERAPAHIAERIGALALAGDAAGVRTWKAIAVRMNSLSGERHARQ